MYLEGVKLVVYLSSVYSQPRRALLVPLVTGPPGGLHCDQVSLGSPGTIYTLATMLGLAGTRAMLVI